MAVYQFAKFHGLGNDFVLIDAREAGGLVDASTAIHLCDRHRGVGADGILTLLPSRTPDADFRMPSELITRTHRSSRRWGSSAV